MSKAAKPLHLNEELAIKGANMLGASVESKFDELKYEIGKKIDKELSDSQNARDYISQKYEELSHKINYLTELDATVTGFRSDVKALENQITFLSTRLDDIEKKVSVMSKEGSSVASSSFQH